MQLSRRLKSTFNVEEVRVISQTSDFSLHSIHISALALSLASPFEIKCAFQNKEPFDSVLAEKKKEGGKDVYNLREDRPQVFSSARHPSNLTQPLI
jgi:hypothetical protein